MDFSILRYHLAFLQKEIATNTQSDLHKVKRMEENDSVCYRSNLLWVTFFNLGKFHINLTYLKVNTNNYTLSSPGSYPLDLISYVIALPQPSTHFPLIIFVIFTEV